MRGVDPGASKGALNSFEERLAVTIEVMCGELVEVGFEILDVRLEEEQGRE